MSMKCSETFYRRGGFLSDGPTRCSSKGVVDRNGVWFCRRHDPVAKKAKRDAENAVYMAKQEAVSQKLKAELSARIAVKSAVFGGIALCDLILKSNTYTTEGVRAILKDLEYARDHFKEAGIE